MASASARKMRRGGMRPARMPSSGTISTFKPVTNALRFELVSARPWIWNMKEANSTRPSTAPDCRSRRCAFHRNGASSTPASAKRMAMIQAGEK
jgi:hypothetical protein